MPKYNLSIRLKHFGQTKDEVEAPTVEQAIEKAKQDFGKKWEVESVVEYTPRYLSDTEAKALDTEDSDHEKLISKKKK